jgi:hypothetical protein
MSSRPYLQLVPKPLAANDAVNDNAQRHQSAATSPCKLIVESLLMPVMFAHLVFLSALQYAVNLTRAGGAFQCRGREEQ